MERTDKGERGKKMGNPEKTSLRDATSLDIVLFVTPGFEFPKRVGLK